MQVPVLVFSLRPENVLPKTLTLKSQIFTTPRSLKKVLRSCVRCLLIVDIFPTDKLNMLTDIVEYVRLGMANPDIQIVVILNESDPSVKDEIFCQYNINGIFDFPQVQTPIYHTFITRTLDSIQRQKQQGKRAEEQLQLLLSVNRFSHHRQPLAQLIHDFSQTLHQFCHSSLSIKVDVKKKLIHKVSFSAIQPDLSVPSPAVLSTLSEQGLERLCEQINTLKSPQVELNIPTQLHQTLESIGITDCGSYLAFPLIVYDHLLCFIVCFVEQENLDCVSISNVNNMKETAQQLRVLLERRSAENRLKSQYQLLKSTLSELQQAKEHLVHSEKMASVGQLAAGIAHEINNPLAYVLGNFAPLDDYVTSLTKVLNFHDQFMENMHQSEHHQDYQQEMSNLPPSPDISFILEDIQAIVNDSREGLLRVKDIISDLNSFSRKQPLEVTEFNLTNLLEETLRILKYELT